jgi:hypothetical protein
MNPWGSETPDRSRPIEFSSASGSVPPFLIASISPIAAVAEILGLVSTAAVPFPMESSPSVK